MKKPILFLLPTLLLVFLATACSGPTAGQSGQEPANNNPTSSQAKTNPLERSDTQGAVAVSVTPLNLEDPQETLDFMVSLETHSEELAMDVAAATMSRARFPSPLWWMANRCWMAPRNST